MGRSGANVGAQTNPSSGGGEGAGQRLMTGEREEENNVRGGDISAE